MPIRHPPGVMMPGVFGPTRGGGRSLQRALDPHHVEHWDALGDAHDQPHAGLDRLDHRIGRMLGRDVDDGGVRPGGLHRVGNPIVDGEVQMPAAALARGHARDEPGTVGDGPLRMERPLPPGDALADDPGAGVDEYGHVSIPHCAGFMRR